MKKHKHSQAGFGTFEVILIILIVAALGFAGWLVWDKNKKDDSKSSTETTTQSSTNNSNETEAQYLTIKELGIKMKLTSDILDAYYVVGATNSADEANARLSTRALDAYPACKPSSTEAGVAVIGSFKQGESSPVVGDYMTAYPKAPKIGDKYYYITGDQYDCTMRQDPALHDKVRKAFLDAYSTIEKL